MMRLINSIFFPRVSRMSISALLVVYAALMISSPPFAHAHVTDVPDYPDKAAEQSCRMTLSGKFFYPYKDNKTRAACIFVNPNLFDSDHCTTMCEEGGSRWKFDTKREIDQTCFCKYT